MNSQLLIQTIANAIAASSMYALIAVGLTLAFGVMQMANLAHGHFFMLGAYTVYALYAKGGWPFWWAVAAAMGVGIVIGLIVERCIFRPLRGDVVAGFIATAGLMFVIEVFAGEMWGWGHMRTIPSPYMHPFKIMGASVAFQRVLVIPFAIVCIGGVMIFMRYFRLGRALRAVAQDPETASLQGININMMTAMALAIAGGLAGIAGGLMSTIYAVTPALGGHVILPALIVVIVGGMGSIEGVTLAAIIMGFVMTFVTTLVDGVTALMVSVAVMALILPIRPQGLMGHVTD
ncbi:branched-chain amino acid ABC transporter permease [Desulfococcaceae bacterium HSG7]|nr:branched-chain amino acid ABC transporter permease [Desulfococcaceae bacterium HSG9]MDM8554675.1 branched-chain amino acid ABC transporter permease [Desulfococcaceae bacterium HSG7]